MLLFLLLLTFLLWELLVVVGMAIGDGATFSSLGDQCICTAGPLQARAVAVCTLPQVCQCRGGRLGRQLLRFLRLAVG